MQKRFAKVRNKKNRYRFLHNNFVKFHEIVYVQTHFDSAKQVVKTLNAKVEEHRNGAEPNDDLTMLCLRVS